MNTIRDIAGGPTIGWLLERENPSVRYFTLTDLLGRPGDDAEPLEARRDIMEAGIVPRILARQAEAGHWGEPDRFYRDKYGGTVWQLMILAELGADGGHPGIRRACEFILENSQDRESGGFSVDRGAKAPGGLKSGVIPCLTGNMAWSLIRLGFLDDPRVQAAIDWICAYQQSDDGTAGPPRGWPYERLEPCFGRHACHMGVVKSLKALAAIPAGRRSAAVKAKIAELTEFLLVHHIHMKSHEPGTVSRPGWLKFGFPLMYQTDILEITGILNSLGCRDARMDAALEIIKAKGAATGRWKLENSFNGKTLERIEAKGKDSKWITLKALTVLKGIASIPG